MEECGQLVRRSWMNDPQDADHVTLYFLMITIDSDLLRTCHTQGTMVSDL